MCRMLVIKSDKPLETKKYFTSLSEMALSGKNSPHRDGFGYIISTNDFMECKKVILPIWESDYPSKKSNFALIHARKASPGYKVHVEHVHPFLCDLKGKTYAFMHNGTIFDIKERENMIDSQYYFKVVIKYLKLHLPGEALRRAALEIENQHRYTSLTSVLTDLQNVWALKHNHSEKDSYYNLYYSNGGSTQIISSEPIENYTKLNVQSKELENKELIKF